ncbi:immunity 26/phosphotriesterase HocA family protein [Brenneria sp. 4F2]|nr:immunity 26/phosphotriesterase HocA family protein [Brenneria bubanii]
MKVKYKEGDIFAIPLSNGKYAICQIIFSPKGKFKQVIAFCLLFIQNDETFNKNGLLNPMSIDKFGKAIKVIFTGNQKISNGLWKIVGYTNLSEEKKKLRVFNYAGGLYNGEEEIRRIPVSEYPNYATMGVSGFELVDNLLTSI